AGSRRARRELPRALPVALALGAVMTAALAVWVRPDVVASTPVLVAVGPWHFHLGALADAAITVGRIAALLAVGTTFALTTEAPALTRALMRQAHLPYRVGYTVLATYRFVPRLLLELDTIRAARRLRGVAPGRGPVAALRRWAGYPFPLLVASIRHAEQVAVSMDGRAFGAFADRTERTVSRWQRRDTVYTLCGLAAAASVWAAAVLIP
ncbi:MAG: energy-coupling factor transporter transmembrane protein EcfT, partial [Candidatus Dormibacteraeota bacterium]|nr:energy-coupling factor transporter transmembrane protein EcfT [Candidatus Dormibacteraeota bacterium]